MSKAEALEVVTTLAQGLSPDLADCARLLARIAEELTVARLLLGAERHELAEPALGSAHGLRVFRERPSARPAPIAKSSGTGATRDRAGGPGASTAKQIHPAAQALRRGA